jgi:ABC-type multidrug transport system fused ATPase/permease subunit
MFFFITVGQLVRVGSDWWVGSWSSDSFHLTQITYIWVYACISILVGILILMKGFFFAKFINRSAQSLQQSLIQTLLKSPLTWFDVTPTGRIISRTTKDQDDLDTSLAFNVQMTLQNILLMFSSIIIAGIATPLYFVCAGIALVVYYFVIRFYMLTSV